MPKLSAIASLIAACVFLTGCAFSEGDTYRCEGKMRALSEERVEAKTATLFLEIKEFRLWRRLFELLPGRSSEGRVYVDAPDFPPGHDVYSFLEKTGDRFYSIQQKPLGSLKTGRSGIFRSLSGRLSLNTAWGWFTGDCVPIER